MSPADHLGGNVVSEPTARSLTMPRIGDGTQVCRQLDPDVFFPDIGQSPAAAQRICLGADAHVPCPFLAACRAWGLAHERYGVWGGLTEQERRQIRRKHRITVQPIPMPDLAPPSRATAQARARRARRRSQPAA
jgi:hypothetical protein